MQVEASTNFGWIQDVTSQVSTLPVSSVAEVGSGGISPASVGGGTTQARYLGQDCRHKSVRQANPYPAIQLAKDAGCTGGAEWGAAACVGLQQAILVVEWQR